MEKQLLTDALVYPTDDVLASELGDCGYIYEMFTSTLPDLKIDLEWRYYQDGKAWLGKAVSNKKTVFWLSVWEGFFRVSFHFTEKTRVGIQNLPIADEIKGRIENAPIKGKLVSLVIDVSELAQLAEIFTLIKYKQSCK